MTPMSLSSLSTTRARSLSRTKTLSVTSRVNRCGSVSVVVEHGSHAGDEAVGGELVRRHVDRNAEVVVAALVLPSVSVRARLLEHPLPDLGDQAGLLGERHEQPSAAPAPGWGAPSAGAPRRR